MMIVDIGFMAKRNGKIPALVAILFFAFGVWCSNLATFDVPTLTSQRGEVEPGCAEASLVFGRIGCEQADITCSSGFVPRSSSKIILTSLPSDGLLKGGKLQVIEGFLPRMTEKTSLWGQQTVSNSHTVAALKTSLHLFHSVLIL